MRRVHLHHNSFLGRDSHLHIQLQHVQLRGLKSSSIHIYKKDSASGRRIYSFKSRDTLLYPQCRACCSQRAISIFASPWRRAPGSTSTLLIYGTRGRGQDKSWAQQAGGRRYWNKHGLVTWRNKYARALGLGIFKVLLEARQGTDI